MIIFEFTHYRKAFDQLFKQQKKLMGNRWSLARLAEQTGIQASYLTNTAKGRAHFSSDQIFAVGEKMGLNEKEIDYLNILMQFERATHPKLKKQLNDQLAQFRNENLRAEKVIETQDSPLGEIEKAKYYLDPFNELLHMYLGLDNAPTEIAAIAKAWQLPEKKTTEILSFLQQIGLVRIKGSKWQVESIHQHLSRDSYLAQPAQMLKRVKAIETIQKQPKEKVYSYIGTFTASEETKAEIQTRFLEFLKQCDKLIRESESKEIYHLQFDLFPWIVG